MCHAIFQFFLETVDDMAGILYLDATHFQKSFNSSFKLGSSITLDSRWWAKCSYGKEVYKSGHNGKDMFQASFNYKDLGVR